MNINYIDTINLIINTSTITMSCQSIMPKFLWKNVIYMLPIEHILKMVTATKSFNIMMDEAIWRHRFYYGRKHNIALIRCDNKRMDGFWKYACYYQIGFRTIDDALSFINYNSPEIINPKSDKYRIKPSRRAHYNKGMLIRLKYNILKNMKQRPIVYYKMFIKDGHYQINYSYFNHTYHNCSVEMIGDNKTIVCPINGIHRSCRWHSLG